MRTSLVLLFALLVPPLAAQEPAPIKLTLHPQAIEAPVLQHRLLPGELEIKPGDAVPILLRLPWEQTIWMQKVYPTLHEWEERDLAAPEWKTAGGVLPPSFFSEMKRAAFRRDANWEYPIGEQRDLYAVLLPDVQGLRSFLAPGLSVKIRYHISRGELNEAREGVLVGLANGRHLAQTPFFVNQLVATAVHRTMLRRVDEIISQPESANLYWPLSSLPDSLLELDRAASLEGHAFATMLPAVHELDRPREAKEWRKMAAQLVELLEQLQEIPKIERPREGANIVETFLDHLDSSGNIHRTTFVKHARSELPTMLNIAPEKVAAMGDEEAGIRWYVHMRLSRDQKSAAVLTMRPREAWPRLAELQKEIQAMTEKTGGKGFNFLGAPGVYVSIWSVYRKIAALRVLEAVRHHAATHEGNLPARLDDIAGLSIPLDPLTDKPFEWKVDGKTATLAAPPLPEVIEAKSPLHATAALKYELEVK